MSHLVSNKFYLKPAVGAVELRALLILNILAVVFIGGLIFVIGIYPTLNTISHAEKKEIFSFVKTYFIVVGIDTFLIFFLLYYSLNRMIRKPLKELEAATLRLTKGDLSVKVATAGPEEVSRLARTLNAMIQSVKSERENTEKRLADVIKINEELKSARKELLHKEALSLVGQMTAGITHEIGNPLGTVNGYIQMLHEETDPEKRILYLKRIESELARINSTLHNLLVFSRQPDYKALPIDVSVVITEAVELIRMNNRVKDMKITLNLDKSLPRALADADGVKQVLNNLIINGADASGNKGEIIISAAEKDSYIDVEVKDHGSGIKPENIDRIFEPFFTTKPSGKGTGLGLAMVKQVMNALNGKIVAENNPEGGAKFILSFRRAG